MISHHATLGQMSPNTQSRLTEYSAISQRTRFGLLLVVVMPACCVMDRGVGRPQDCLAVADGCRGLAVGPGQGSNTGGEDTGLLTDRA
jgi:hypothetical protein